MMPMPGGRRREELIRRQRLGCCRTGGDIRERFKTMLSIRALGKPLSALA